jgi:hypothetical protein
VVTNSYTLDAKTEKIKFTFAVGTEDVYEVRIEVTDQVIMSNVDVKKSIV